MPSKAVAVSALSLALALTLSLPLSGQEAAIHRGADVLERMHQHYARRWFSTLAFDQKTTRTDRTGATHVETWHESLQWNPATGAWLRIDMGDLAAGNGSLSTADSTWTYAGGKLTAIRGEGNPFIPLIENVYMQPVAVTLKQLEPLHFDMTRVLDTTWEGRPAWIVGAASAVDSTSPQFWIDKERLVVVRMVILLAPNRPPFDIHLDNYVATGGGWLATKVTMLSGGIPRQVEEYSGWKTRARLDRKLFDPPHP